MGNSTTHQGRISLQNHHPPGLAERPCKRRDCLGAYHLARKSGNFGLKSNGKAIFQKFHSEIVEYLQRYSFFSVWNGTVEIFLPFAKLSSFQSLISWEQWREIELQMISAISFDWFGDFGKSLTINQRSSQPDYSDKWYYDYQSSKARQSLVTTF